VSADKLWEYGRDKQLVAKVSEFIKNFAQILSGYNVYCMSYTLFGCFHLGFLNSSWHLFTLLHLAELDNASTE